MANLEINTAELKTNHHFIASQEAVYALMRKGYRRTAFILFYLFNPLNPFNPFVRNRAGHSYQTLGDTL